MHALGIKYRYEWNDVKCSDCHQYTCKKGKVFTSLCYVDLFRKDRGKLRERDETHVLKKTVPASLSR